MLKDNNMKELEKQDEKLRHEPVTIYCLGCGMTISNNFTGGLWSYTHLCNRKEMRNDIPHVSCVIFGSKERGVMLPSSLVCGYKSFARCKECKNELEHIKKVLEGCLGKGWQDNKMPDKDIEKLRQIAVLKITACTSKEYGNKVMAMYPQEFKNG